MPSHPEDPKDTGFKVPGFTYAWMIPYLTRIGRRHGYAMAFHGSMSRDLDVVAVPWVVDANPPHELIDEILKLTGGRLKLNDGTLTSSAIDDAGQPVKNAFGEKPHGRRAYTIAFDGAWHFIDLSVIPVPV